MSQNTVPILQRNFIFSSTMGRTKDTIWTKFTILSASGATDKVKCSKCEYTCTILYLWLYFCSSSWLSKPPMPSETRWCSMNDLVEYYEKNYTSIAVCVQKVSRTTDKVYRFSEEIQLRRECKSLLEFLGPVMKALNTLQGDNIF